MDSLVFDAQFSRDSRSLQLFRSGHHIPCQSFRLRDEGRAFGGEIRISESIFTVLHYFGAIDIAEQVTDAPKFAQVLTLTKIKMEI